MKRLEYTGFSETDLRMTKAIELSELLLIPNSPMMKELIAINTFKYDSGDGKKIVEELLKKRNLVSVHLYKSFSIWPVVGKTDGKDIYINSRKVLERSIQETAATILHEYSHICGFSHGNNTPSQDKYMHSVPYYISENASRWFEALGEIK